jgi:hypothetical protein
MLRSCFPFPFLPWQVVRRHFLHRRSFLKAQCGRWMADAEADAAAARSNWGAYTAAAYTAVSGAPAAAPAAGTTPLARLVGELVRALDALSA